MARLPGFRRVFRFPWRNAIQIEQEIDDEFAFHIEMRTRELVEKGMTPEAARNEALRQFGDLAGSRRHCRALDGRTEKKRRRSMILGELWHDLRFGLRMLVKSPGFTAVALFTLALGIGANTAMFSIINGVLLQSLPFPNPEQLVRIHTQRTGRSFGGISEPEFIDIQESTESFQAIGLAQPAGINLFEGEGEPEYVLGVRVTSGAFETLGIRPQVGRPLQPEESFVGNHQVVLLSDGLWHRRFGADPAVVGRTLRIRNDNYQIIGVMPEGFEFLYKDADLWIGFGMDRANLRPRGAHPASIVARLQPNVTVEQAQSELEILSRRLRQKHPTYDSVGGGFHFVAQPYLDNVVGSVRPALLTLLVAVGLVLLIACANVANLLLSRITRRERELAIRAALGAGHGRILRQMITECLLLSLLGGLGALVVARWAFDGLVLLHPDSLPRMGEVGLDTTVLAFNIGLVVFTTLAVGAVPAIRISRMTWSEKLKEGARQGGVASRQRSRAMLVVAEVALATVLLVGAGLLIRSFQQLLSVDPGFRAEQVLTTQVTLSEERYPDMPDRAGFYRQLMDELASQPGVISAAAVSILPMSGNRMDWYLSAEDYKPANPNTDFIQYRQVTPDYFKTLGIPLVRGRAFTNHDRADTQLVVILSESLANRFWGELDPIGRRVRPGGPSSTDPWHEVVGIVGEVYHSGARQGEVPIWYQPVHQMVWSSMTLAVRTTGDPSQAVQVVKDAVGRIDPYQPIYRTRVMTEVVSDSLSQERLNANLLIAFAGLALGLAAVGVYGVIAYSVSQRTREIGMRMALGAESGRVLRSVLGEGLRLVLAGLVIGIAAALVLTRFLRWLLFGVAAGDPVTFIAVAVVLSGAGLLACILPARRAARVDPLVALRYE